MKRLFLYVLYFFAQIGEFVIGVFHFIATISIRKSKRSTKEVILYTGSTSKRRARVTRIQKAWTNIKKASYNLIVFGSRSVFFEVKNSILKLLVLLKKPFIRKRKQKKAFYKPSFFYKLRFFILGIFVSFFLIFLPLLSYIFLSDLPNPASLSANYIPKTTKLYDRNGKLLYEIYANQNRTLVKLSHLPQNLINATIAIEDKDFYSHPGFDIRGIARAVVANVTNGELQGGSTITQQLIKSAYFTPTPQIIRKVKEVALAFWAERIYSKNQILELYFNYVPYGGTTWGIEAASEVYFNKKASDLTLAESAFLAGLPKAPSIYSPYASNGNLWRQRQKEVLDAMVKQNMISQSQAQKAYEQTLVFKGQDTRIKAPHFVMYVKDLLIKKYGLAQVEKGGLQVTTTLDLTKQEDIQKIVADEVEANKYLNLSNGAALVTNPSTGEIIAMVGSKNYFDQEQSGNVNVTLQSRQPGSTIKLVTYTLALASGLTEATVIDDSPLTIKTDTETYSPVNYDGRYHGRLPIRLVFANSLNIPAVKVAQRLGVKNIVAMGQQMGISSWTDPNRYGISITLGGAEVTMLDLATAYGTIADEGYKVDLDPLLEVKDFSGTSLYKHAPVKTQVVSDGVAFIISNILADNNARSMEFGSNSPLTIPNHKVSVKTGTTDNKRDNWTIGFTKNYLAATWVGNNDNSPMSQSLTSGITGAAPIWNKIMTYLLKNTKDEPLVAPTTVVKKSCYGFDAYFIRGTENASCGAYFISPTPTR